jgi:hypothetical protein
MAVPKVAPWRRLGFGFRPHRIQRRLMARSRKKLGDILVGWGVVTPEQVEKATVQAKTSGKRLGDTMVEAGYAKEDQVAKALANQFGMEYVDLSANGVATQIDMKLVPEELVKKHLILPLAKTNGKLQPHRADEGPRPRALSHRRRVRRARPHPAAHEGPADQRMKIMAGIDIAEKRLPQDGRIKLQVDKQQIDFRVSTLPAYHGESVVLRILRPDSVRIGIQNLGFEEDDYKAFQKIIKRPNGIFLVTGPDRFGQDDDAVRRAQRAESPDRKIITAEDPVEYNFVGINQCQVRENIGLTFAKILRAMLRQAPNIILVGEIRDLEVAEVAIQAALTGHLVFSTLHTNDAPGAITRLIDMGVKPFLVASRSRR